MQNRTQLSSTRNPATPSRQTLIRVLFLLTLIAAAFSPQVVTSLFSLFRKQLDDDDTLEIKPVILCENSPISQTYKSDHHFFTASMNTHTLFSPSITNYFDRETGILHSYKIRLERLNEKCTVFPSKSIAELLVAMHASLLEHRILYVAEQHEDCFTTQHPAYLQLLEQAIVPYMPKGTLLFHETITEVEAKRLSIIALDERGSRAMQFSQAILLLTKALALPSIPKNDLVFLKYHFAELFFYHSHGIWSQLLKNKALTGSESTLCTHIIDIIKKNGTYDAMIIAVDEWLPIFIRNNNVLFTLLVKFADALKSDFEHIPVVQKFSQSFTQYMHKFIQKKVMQSDYDKLIAEAEYFLVHFRNDLWVEKIKRYLSEYQKQHSTPAYAIVAVGEDHVSDLQLKLKALPLLDQPQMQL